MAAVAPVLTALAAVGGYANARAARRDAAAAAQTQRDDFESQRDVEQARYDEAPQVAGQTAGEVLRGKVAAGADVGLSPLAAAGAATGWSPASVNLPVPPRANPGHNAMGAASNLMSGLADAWTQKMQVDSATKLAATKANIDGVRVQTELARIRLMEAQIGQIARSAEAGHTRMDGSTRDRSVPAYKWVHGPHGDKFLVLNSDNIDAEFPNTMMVPMMTEWNRAGLPRPPQKPPSGSKPDVSHITDQFKRKPSYHRNNSWWSR